MPLPRGYRESIHPARDRFAAEAAWRFFTEEACEHRVLPDGRCDIILRFQSDGVRPLGPVTVLVTGAATRFHMVSLPQGASFVGVRLRPGTARGVLGLDLVEISNSVLVGGAAVARAPALAALCAPASSIDELSDRLDAFVAERSRTMAVDSRTVDLIDTIHTTGGRLPVSDMAALHGIEVRTARRLITSATGLGPKQLAMVIQFHRALRLRFEEGLDIASTVFEAGYSDHAHMARVFRAMGDISPKRAPDMVLAGLPI